ncbi:MAG: phosphoenolpyruvate carboxykinase (GTP), partial [Acidimicrobiia bacterium]|nr:phosphoenolpyruvate carboxykinase (GTP) [Acidimicrobiia bacterium]
EWVLRRVDGDAEALDTPIGRVPAADALDTRGLDLDPTVLAELLTVDSRRWRAEVPKLREHYDSLGLRLPTELRDQLAVLEKRLGE